MGAFSFSVSRSFVAVSAFYNVSFILLWTVERLRWRGYKSSQIRYKAEHHNLVQRGKGWSGFSKVGRIRKESEEGLSLFSGSRLVIGLRTQGNIHLFSEMYSCLAQSPSTFVIVMTTYYCQSIEEALRRAKKAGKKPGSFFGGITLRSGRRGFAIYREGKVVEQYTFIGR